MKVEGRCRHAFCSKQNSVYLNNLKIFQQPLCTSPDRPPKNGGDCVQPSPPRIPKKNPENPAFRAKVTLTLLLKFNTTSKCIT